MRAVLSACFRLKLLRKHVFGLPSDGMVPFADSLIPGCEAIKVSGVDHAEPVLLVADKIAMLGATLKVTGSWLGADKKC